MLEKYLYYNLYSLFLIELEDLNFCIWIDELKKVFIEKMKSFFLRFVMNERFIGLYKWIRSVRGIVWIILFGYY